MFLIEGLPEVICRFDLQFKILPIILRGIFNGEAPHGGTWLTGAHNQETSREKLATNCDGNRVENQNCDRTENNYDQDCSQSLLKKQSDDDIKEEEGDGEAGEAKQVIEDQISLEEWGEDDLQVG